MTTTVFTTLHVLRNDSVRLSDTGRWVFEPLTSEFVSVGRLLKAGFLFAMYFMVLVHVRLDFMTFKKKNK